MEFQRNWPARHQTPEALVFRVGAGKTMARGESRLRPCGVEDAINLDQYCAVRSIARKAGRDIPQVPEAHIAHLSRYILGRNARPVWGLCHGTRHGEEQKWFRQYLGPQARVFGTKKHVSTTDHPFTIQWDFHDLDPAWLGIMDVVHFSASEQCHDPARAFEGWAACLAPGGFLLVDHVQTDRQDGTLASALPGLSEAGLCAMIDRVCGRHGQVTEVIECHNGASHLIRTVVFRAHDAVASA